MVDGAWLNLPKSDAFDVNDNEREFKVNDLHCKICADFSLVVGVSQLPRSRGNQQLVFKHDSPLFAEVLRCSALLNEYENYNINGKSFII